MAFLCLRSTMTTATTTIAIICDQKGCSISLEHVVVQGFSSVSQSLLDPPHPGRPLLTLLTPDCNVHAENKRGKRIKRKRKRHRHARMSSPFSHSLNPRMCILRCEGVHAFIHSSSQIRVTLSATTSGLALASSALPADL